jgi:hypothetical protein
MSLLQKIKELRARKAGEFKKIAKIAEQARTKVEQATSRTIEVKHDSGDYFFREKAARGDPVFTRPIRKDLYVRDPIELKTATASLFTGEWKSVAAGDLERVVYTVTQDVGAFLDFFGGNSSRKALGTFFESVVATIISRITSRSVGSGSLELPGYEANVSFDLGVHQGREAELLVATKTSTRERLSQPFVQVAILRGATEQKTKCILVVIGDVQRKEGASIAHTFTAGQFRLYSQFIAKLDGVFYCDIPPQAESLVKDGLLAPLSKLPEFLQLSLGE